MAWYLKFLIGFLILPVGLFVSVRLMELTIRLRGYYVKDWKFWSGYAVVCIALGFLAVWIL